MEQIYNYILEAVTKVSKAEFQLFQKLHEQSRNGAPKIKDEITKEVLMEVSKKPILQMKHLFIKDEIIETIELMGEKEIRELVDGDKQFEIVKKFSMWKNHILISLKLEYLNGLLSCSPANDAKIFSHKAGALAIKLLFEAHEYGEDYFTKSVFIKLASSKFNHEMLAAKVKNPETNETTYRALRSLTKEFSGSRSRKKFASWAKDEHQVDYDLALKLINKHWPDFDISRIPYDLPS